MEINLNAAGGKCWSAWMIVFQDCCWHGFYAFFHSIGVLVAMQEVVDAFLFV
jgi:hypothetical protein